MEHSGVGRGINAVDVHPLLLAEPSLGHRCGRCPCVDPIVERDTVVAVSGINHDVGLSLRVGEVTRLTQLHVLGNLVFLSVPWPHDKGLCIVVHGADTKLNLHESCEISRSRFLVVVAEENIAHKLTARLSLLQARRDGD